MKLRSWMVALAAVGLVACGGEEGERVEMGGSQQSETRPDARETWSPELTAAIDSANALYAADDYEGAAALFTEITEDNPDLGVAWFGLYMAERARGNDEAADEALAKAEEFSPGLGRMHDAATDSMQRVPMEMQGHPGMPSGHPPVDSMMPEQGEQSPQPTGGR